MVTRAMGVTAEVTPAELPLPGGQDGATVRLHPLLTGTAVGADAFFHRHPGRLARLRAMGFRVPDDGWVQFPMPAFCVEHPHAGPILIDTGMHASVAVNPRDSMGPVQTFPFKDFAMDSSQAIPAQLRARGIDPGHVPLVVMTHLHADHTSGMSQFPHATFLFTAEEWRAANRQGELHGYRKRHFDHAFDYRTINFDGAGTQSFATFGRSFDLFGDGSVRLVYTPGHTRGHMSVVLRLSDREALVAGDAIYTMDTLLDTRIPPRMEDEHKFMRSLREIRLYADQTERALIIPGHDMDAWNLLLKVYE